MNFFGHALLAQRHKEASGELDALGAVRPEFVLGAMLPDFASMLRTRPPEATLDSVRAGLTFHHRTDDAFHGCRSFLEFSQQAATFLGSCDAHGRGDAAEQGGG